MEVKFLNIMTPITIRRFEIKLRTYSPSVYLCLCTMCYIINRSTAMQHYFKIATYSMYSCKLLVNIRDNNESVEKSTQNAEICLF